MAGGSGAWHDSQASGVVGDEGSPARSMRQSPAETPAGGGFADACGGEDEPEAGVSGGPEEAEPLDMARTAYLGTLLAELGLGEGGPEAGAEGEEQPRGLSGLPSPRREASRLSPVREAEGEEREEEEEEGGAGGQVLPLAEGGEDDSGEREQWPVAVGQRLEAQPVALGPATAGPDQAASARAVLRQLSRRQPAVPLTSSRAVAASAAASRAAPQGAGQPAPEPSTAPAWPAATPLDGAGGRRQRLEQLRLLRQRGRPGAAAQALVQAVDGAQEDPRNRHAEALAVVASGPAAGLGPPVRAASPSRHRSLGYRGPGNPRAMSGGLVEGDEAPGMPVRGRGGACCFGSRAPPPAPSHGSDMVRRARSCSAAGGCPWR